MKKIVFLLIISFFLAGCPIEDREERYYILENTSNHILELKFYREGLFLDYLNKTIPEGESHRGAVTYENEEIFSFPSSAYKSDSIVIDFDNLKRRTYAIDFLITSFSEPLNRNIFRHENYEHIGNDRFLFSITEEDYDSAEDIN